MIKRAGRSQTGLQVVRKITWYGRGRVRFSDDARFVIARAGGMAMGADGCGSVLSVAHLFGLPVLTQGFGHVRGHVGFVAHDASEDAADGRSSEAGTRISPDIYHLLHPHVHRARRGASLRGFRPVAVHRGRLSWAKGWVRRPQGRLRPNLWSSIHFAAGEPRRDRRVAGVQEDMQSLRGSAGCCRQGKMCELEADERVQPDGQAAAAPGPGVQSKDPERVERLLRVR